ncbi:MAG: HXXEE domain-containing protein [Bacteroidales bacterium]
MNFTNWLILAFPVVFIIHSITELFLLKPWLRRNALLISEFGSGFTKGALTIFKKLSTKSIAIIAFEEFLIISLVTTYGLISGNYYPWIAILCGFFFHLFIQIANWMSYMRYTPSIITIFLSAAFCIFALDYSIHEIDLSIIKIIIYGISGTIFSSANLFLLIRISIFLKYNKLKDTNPEAIG